MQPDHMGMQTVLNVGPDAYAQADGLWLVGDRKDVDVDDPTIALALASGQLFAEPVPESSPAPETSFPVPPPAVSESIIEGDV